MSDKTGAHRTDYEGRLHGLLTWMVNHPRRIILGAIVLTIVLTVAGISLKSSEQASFNPSGEIFDTADTVQRTFRSSTTDLPFIVVDEGGDVLDAESLREWRANSEALRSSAEFAPKLTTYFDENLGVTVEGTYSIADAVHDALVADGLAGGLNAASDDQVKAALSSLLDESQPTAAFRDDLSIHATSAEESVGGQTITVWRSPAFLANVRVDHAAFPVDLEDKTDPATRTNSQQDEIDFERGLEIERYARDVREVLRADEVAFEAWGVGIDATLTDDESFVSTIPFLLGAILLIVALVAGLMRSYWAGALAGSGLILAMLWARMINNLLGFEESIVLDVIVPIAMISFGVDFMIHAVTRCREELSMGRDHRSAYAVGLATIAGALALALSTSAIAFGSNATSGIEAITQFGFGAAVSLGTAFVVLGLLAPMFLLRIEEGLPPRKPTTGLLRRAGQVAAVLGVGLLSALGVIASIGVPIAGFGLFLIHGGVAIALPYWLVRRGKSSGTAPAAAETGGPDLSHHAGRVIIALVRARYAVVAIVLAVTIAAIAGAANVGRKTEPNDFYPSNSDLMVGVDKVLEHTSSIGGGDVIALLEGDLATPATLAAATQAIERVGDQGGDLFARNPDGSLAAPESALDIARTVITLEAARDSIEAATGVVITDDNGDGLPDTAEQLEAIFTFAAVNGVPGEGSAHVYTAERVGRMLQQTDGGQWATVLRFPLQGFLDSGEVDSARSIVEEGADAIVAASAGGVSARVSGEAVTTQARIDAITEAMVVSVPLAVILCLVVAALVMRSPAVSAVTVVPIVLVICWLLGFMYAFDYDLNVVTATIAAISVGVGIDYAIHFTMRYREELAAGDTRIEAITQAASGTGLALFLSAATSIVGFAFLALAPMPVFAAYGLLTAVMIALSLVASLCVLPSLLYFASREPAAERAPEAPGLPAGG